LITPYSGEILLYFAVTIDEAKGAALVVEDLLVAEEALQFNLSIRIVVLQPKLRDIQYE